MNLNDSFFSARISAVQSPCPSKKAVCIESAIRELFASSSFMIEKRSMITLMMFLDGNEVVAASSTLRLFLLFLLCRFFFAVELSQENHLAVSEACIVLWKAVLLSYKFYLKY